MLGGRGLGGGLGPGGQRALPHGGGSARKFRRARALRRRGGRGGGLSRDARPRRSRPSSRAARRWPQSREHREDGRRPRRRDARGAEERARRARRRGPAHPGPGAAARVEDRGAGERDGGGRAATGAPAAARAGVASSAPERQLRRQRRRACPSSCRRRRSRRRSRPRSRARSVPVSGRRGRARRGRGSGRGRLGEPELGERSAAALLGALRADRADVAGVPLERSGDRRDVEPFLVRQRDDDGAVVDQLGATSSGQALITSSALGTRSGVASAGRASTTVVRQPRSLP